MDNEMLKHYGILGMKWGRRRYQNKDGTLTDAGKKRYDVDIDAAKNRVDVAKENLKKATSEYNKKKHGGLIYDQKEAERLSKAKGNKQWAKRQLRSEKIKNKLNKESGKKSKRRLELEQKYRDKGMSQDEAEIAAYKRVRTEKIIAATAGMTIAAASAYLAYRHYDKTVDRFIKTGSELQNISNNSNKGVSDAFYFSMTKGDNQKYRGLYGSVIKQRGENVYETKIGVKKALKVASEKSATRELSDLIKSDTDYAKTLKEHLTNSIGRYSTDKQKETIVRGLGSLNKGKIDSNVYKALNLTLVDHTLPTSSKISEGFYNKLKSSGYDVIMDINDKHLSGYRSSKPMIAFNAGSKATINRVREVGEQEIKKAASKGMMDINIKSLLPSAVGLAGASGLVAAGVRAMENRNNDLIVRQYREEHPNTNLSYNQILDNFYSS